MVFSANSLKTVFSITAFRSIGDVTGKDKAAIPFRSIGDVTGEDVMKTDQTESIGHSPNLKGKEIVNEMLCFSKNFVLINSFKLQGPDISLNRQAIFEMRHGWNNGVKDESFREDFLKQRNQTFEDKVGMSIFLNISDLKEEKNYTQMECSEVQLKTNMGYINMQEFRKSLPTYSKKQAFVETIRDNQVVLIKGPTGSGKTTQICQYILEAVDSARIICTQPRRIAATIAAERVATERGESLGYSIGYHVRLGQVLPRKTDGSIVFCTAGVLLKMLESDSSLPQYSHVFIDAVHERQIHTDVLLGLLKLVLKQRKDLKVILMSATFNAAQFSVYFNKCPVIDIPGFAYKVEEYFLEDVLQETNYNFKPPKYLRATDREDQILYEQQIRPYVNSIRYEYPNNVIENLLKKESEGGDLRLVEELIHHIARKRSEGAILVFLPGHEQVFKLLKRMQMSRRFPPKKFRIYPLHSMLSEHDHCDIFAKPPEGVRKVILSTQIAESSIPIDDVVYVINSGKSFSLCS